MVRENLGKRFEGYQIYDRHYEKVGKVDDLFVDENDVPEYIGVKTGLFGGPSTLIPMDIVRVNDPASKVHIDKRLETCGACRSSRLDSTVTSPPSMFSVLSLKSICRASPGRSFTVLMFAL